jgi:hypothetical protein
VSRNRFKGKFADFLNARHGVADAPEEATPVETPVATPVLAAVPTPVATPVETPVREREPYLDATHSPSEKSIYSVMYRETVNKGLRERHFGFKELSTKTGIRSDATMRRALDGLIAKLSIEIVAYSHGNPLGPKYRVYEPKEIIRRRKAAGVEIDPQSKKITTAVATGVSTGVATGLKGDGSTPATSTPVTPATSAGDINKSKSDLNIKDQDDDEKFRPLIQKLLQAEREVTGANNATAEDWSLYADSEAERLRRIAAKTCVSNVPAILAADSRRAPVQPKPERKATYTGPVNTPAEPMTKEAALEMWETSAGSPTFRSQLEADYPEYFSDHGQGK